MNAAARAMDLGSTRFADPSGLDPGSVSTPADMIRLGEAAMTIPVFHHGVAMPQVTLPLAGLVYNSTTTSVTTGSSGSPGHDVAAGGCFLFQAQQEVAGKSLTLVGAVLGQYGTALPPPPFPMPTPGACGIRRNRHAPSCSAGASSGRVGTPWGVSVPVTASESTSIVGWPGLLFLSTCIWGQYRQPSPAAPASGCSNSISVAKRSTWLFGPRVGFRDPR